MMVSLKHPKAIIFVLFIVFPQDLIIVTKTEKTLIKYVLNA